MKEMQERRGIVHFFVMAMANLLCDMIHFIMNIVRRINDAIVETWVVCINPNL